MNPSSRSDPSGEPSAAWSLGGRKAAAWIALVALIVIVVRLATLAYTATLELLGVVAFAAMFGLGVWWAIVGRTVKHRLGVTLAALGGGLAVVALVALALQAPRQVFGLVGGVVVFAFFSARALSLGSRYRRWKENRVALPADAAEATDDLANVTVPAGLIVNEKSGGGKAEQVRLAHRAREMGIRVKVLGPHDDLIDLAEGLIADGVQILGMAGGDGSLGLVADVARHHDLPFVCIPVGTRNHFARDLGLDRSYPLGALTAFYGHEIRVDVATITSGDGRSRPFLNNASFGAYADMVQEPGYRDAKLETAQKLVSETINGDRPPSSLVFANPAGQQFDSAFLIMVAVGPYELDSIGDLGVRSSLDSGELQISVLEPSDAPQLRRLTAAAVVGSLSNADGFWQWVSTELRVESPTGTINVGVDGEALQLASPVEIGVEQGALRVLVPEAIEAVPGPQTQSLGVTVSDLWKLAVGSEDDASVS